MTFGVAVRDQPVQYLKGVGPKKAELLTKLGVVTVSDLLFLFPHRYEDRSAVKKIAEIEAGQVESVRATVRETSASYRSRGGRRVFEVSFGDETGVLKGIWFRAPAKAYQARFEAGSRWLVTGKVDFDKYKGSKRVTHPECAPLGDEEGDDEGDTLGPKILPVYPLTEGLPQRAVRSALLAAQEYVHDLVDFLPDSLNQTYRLPPLAEALRQLHWPEPDADVARLNAFDTRAHKKLVFNEFFITQAALALKRRQERAAPGDPFDVGDALMAKIRSVFPFPLTGAQSRALDEIAGDFASGHPMNRLLQGDVGSGKTAVALGAALIAVRNKKQAALMVPTEILAAQHHRNLTRLLAKTPVNVVLLTAGSDGKKETQAAIADGSAHIVVGTHALIQDGVAFHDLGLAIVDEQHRFGVRQRAALMARGHRVHALIMTATPIPRTLAMTAYGDLDVTVIDELPPGRTPIETTVYPPSRRGDALARLREEVAKGRQAYVIYPLVEESEKLELKAATTMFEELQKEGLAGLRLGLTHGRMKPAEKDAVMAAFRDGTVDVLVSTTVVEVGVDVANATAIMIEHAERFGLSQLHQLRGRVGRSSHRSCCLLMADTGPGAPGWERLKVMARHQDGFAVAEADLALRGAGDFFGVKQSGVAQFRLGDILRDQVILAEARKVAFAVVERDPTLSAPEWATLKKGIEANWATRFALGEIG
ncbi:MAG: ATP-dependent DNA helicase RecG [Nitrospinae bacterium]|nr:ATP-dependent DNA helicase RecG [Nitrospinota bacterium]